jgi:CDP-diacylglycerol--glycerol-3-phosphate 3-phosphatidyltransferase
MDATALRWLPNAITVARLCAVPVLAGVILSAEGPTTTLGAALFTAVAATDLVDGVLARRLGAESQFGRVADPLADRLVVAVGLLGLIVLGRIPWPGPTIVLARDAVSVAAYLWFARRGRILLVDTPGKVSSALVMVATALALLSTAEWIDALFWAAVVLSVATLVNYARTALTSTPA